MAKVLIADKIKIDGLEIKYRVFGEAPNPTNPIFVLDLQNLYYSTKNLHPVADSLGKWSGQSHIKANVINIDFPGVGESDKSTKPDQHYTIPFYTETAARVIEAVKEKLLLDSLQLVVSSALDSTMVAMNLPQVRPQWAEKKSPIQLRLFINRFAQINGASVVKEVKKRCEFDPKLPQYLAAIEKLEKGEVANNADFVKNVLLKLAPLGMETGLGFSLYKSILSASPNGVAGFLKFLRAISPTQSLSNNFTVFIESLQGNHTDVLNQFYKTQFGGFDLETVVANNRELYSKVPMVFFNALDSVLAPKYRHADVITNMLPNAVSSNMKGKEFECRFVADALVKELLEGSYAKNHPVTSEFSQQYQAFKDEVLNEQQNVSSTLCAFRILDVTAKQAPVAAPVVVIGAAPAQQAASRVEVEVDQVNQVNLGFRR